MVSAWRWAAGVAEELGLDARRARASLRRLPAHLRNRSAYRRLTRGVEGALPLGAWKPSLHDAAAAGGVARGHYFHGDLWTAQKVFARRPRRHVDVGSRVDGLVAHIASFREVEVVDIRPTAERVRNVTFVSMDVMAGAGPLAGACDSVSCLHALEHFGLGRYGDPIDPVGHLKGWASLAAMLEPGGRLYFSTPIGPSRVEFDAHRVFGVPYLLERMIDPLYEVVDFAYVGNSGRLHEGVDVRSEAASRSFGLSFGCGLFELVKRGGAGPGGAASRAGG